MEQRISWNLTQHAKIMDRAEIIPFLEEVSKYNGDVPDVKKLNEELAIRGILTKNERDGKSDTWRDYQQVLPTLGLIYSTKFQKKIILTPIANALLEKQITYDDFITIQILRLQYPNGNSVGNSSNNIWATQFDAGMKVKPGVMILRILIELFESGQSSHITVNECQKFLISALNGHFDIETLITYRAQKRPRTPQENKYARRNVQDWFKLLAKSYLFRQDGDDTLFLSDLSQNSIPALKLLVEKCLSFYWEPKNFDLKDKIDWFNYIGSLPNSEFSLLPRFGETLEFGKDDGKHELLSNMDVSQYEIKLGNVANSLNSLGKEINSSEYAKSGVKKRQVAYDLHDSIVRDIAAVFEKAGGKVSADRNSIDLYAEDGSVSLLIEVKTTNPVNVIKQIRLAVGQVLEYQYRLAKECELVIVVSSIIEQDIYLVDFLRQLNISLICWNTYQVKFYPANDQVKSIFGKFMSYLPESIKV